MRHEFHPEALAEYEAAAVYSAERDPAVGQRFIVAVEDAIDRILDSPTRWRVLDEDVRRCLTRVLAVTGVIAVVSCAKRLESGYAHIGPDSLPSASYERPGAHHQRSRANVKGATAV